MDHRIVVFLLCSLGLSSATPDALSGERFFAEVDSDEKVWLITFGLAPGAEYDAGIALAEKVDWLNVAWMDMADPESRLIADLHEVQHYPSTYIMNRNYAAPLPLKDITLKNAIERFIPDRVREGKALKSLLPTNPPASGKICVFGSSAVPEEEQAGTLYIAAARAVALRFREKGFAFYLGESTARIECKVDDEVILTIENDGKEGFAHSEMVSAIQSACSPHYRSNEEREELLKVRREYAGEHKTESLLPEMSFSAWKKSAADAAQGVQAIFFLDSRSEDFAAQHAVAVDVAKSGGGKMGQKAPFSFLWADVSKESQVLLNSFEIQVNPKGRAKGVPTVNFIVPIQKEVPGGGREHVRAVSVSDRSVTKNFDANVIIKYIEKSLIGNTGQIREFHTEALQDEETFAVSGESVSDENDVDSTLTWAGEDESPEVAEKRATKKREQAAQQKAKEAEKKKKSKKKEKSAKQLKKEADEKEKLAKEMEQKKLAREQRLKEKKEKEEAEKIARAEAKAEEKKNKSKQPKDKTDKKGKKETKAEKKKREEKKKKDDKKKNDKKKKEEKKRKVWYPFFPTAQHPPQNQSNPEIFIRIIL